MTDSHEPDHEGTEQSSWCTPRATTRRRVVNVFRRGPRQVSLEELVEQIEQTADYAEAASLNVRTTTTGAITPHEVRTASGRCWVVQQLREVSQ